MTRAVKYGGIERRLHFGRLLNLTGLYVVRFPDAVKVGRSARTWARLRTHAEAGGIEATVFEARDARSIAIADYERRALGAVRARGAGAVLGRSEHFTGLTYGEVMGAVRGQALHGREVVFPDLTSLYLLDEVKS